MPPKKLITKNSILEAAARFVIKEGFSSLNARRLAKELGCSTKPIYAEFGSMGAMTEELLSLAFSEYSKFINERKKLGRYPEYKAYGMAYLAFAAERTEMYKLLFMTDAISRPEERDIHNDRDRQIMNLSQGLGISKEYAEKIQLSMWIFTHGLASLLVSGVIPYSEEVLSEMMSAEYQALAAYYVDKERGNEGK